MEATHPSETLLGFQRITLHKGDRTLHEHPSFENGAPKYKIAIFFLLYFGISWTRQENTVCAVGPTRNSATVLCRAVRRERCTSHRPDAGCHFLLARNTASSCSCSAPCFWYSCDEHGTTAEILDPAVPRGFFQSLQDGTSVRLYWTVPLAIVRGLPVLRHSWHRKCCGSCGNCVSEMTP
jgi:hypothetical protein